MAITKQTYKPSSVSVPVAGNERIVKVTLQNGGITVDLTNIGCAVMSIHTPDKNGESRNIVAGFSDPLQYMVNKDYFGVVAGRYANRIDAGKFELEGNSYQLTQNNGVNHLHGGFDGLSHKVWEVSALAQNENQCGVMFSYVSKDGEEGYPGNLSVTVLYTLDEDGRLQIDYTATTDKSTPVNLTNHSYFNLTGFEEPSVLQHALKLFAGFYTEKNENNIPTGKILPVQGTGLDFRELKRIGEDIGKMVCDGGFDHNFVLDARVGLKEAALLTEDSTGRTLKVYTSKPGIQVYTGNSWDGKTTGQQGVPYQRHGAVALETQAFPDSVNHPHFPDTIVHPGSPYRSTTIFEFGISSD
ncbi:MAG: aldose epimerase family protein [Pseudobacter sp.]|uniref:aldose epimerase family protein n=1 Tax=Pseudobacter sp. TaxID=2045420 RepID=UPI003F7D187D